MAIAKGIPRACVVMPHLEIKHGSVPDSVGMGQNVAHDE